MTCFCVYRFCTTLRSTFRESAGASSNDEIKSATERHSAFYNVGRALYEAADHFGKIMGPKQRVYHGLSQRMKFASFTEYFNAPTSTMRFKSVGT